MSVNDLDLDPFAAQHDVTVDGGLQQDIHIRIQQRNGRKSVTTIQGIPKEYDLKKLLKEFKKTFACNGTILDADDSTEKIGKKVAKPEPAKTKAAGRMAPIVEDPRSDELDETTKSKTVEDDGDKVRADGVMRENDGKKTKMDKAKPAVKPAGDPKARKEEKLSDTTSQVIQLQGDQRVKCNDFLKENGIPEANIKVHGF